MGKHGPLPFVVACAGAFQALSAVTYWTQYSPIHLPWFLWRWPLSLGLGASAGLVAWLVDGRPGALKALVAQAVVTVFMARLVEAIAPYLIQAHAGALVPAVAGLLVAVVLLPSDAAAAAPGPGVAAALPAAAAGLPAGAALPSPGAGAPGPAPQAAKAPAGPIATRSAAEQFVYIDLHPCACGERRHAIQGGAIHQRGANLVSRLTWACPRCKAERALEFLVPAQSAFPGGAYGGPEPSRVIDAGQWLLVSDAAAKVVPSTRASLEQAILAMEEVLKFVPPGAMDEAPPAAFFTPDGTAYRAAQPTGTFKRFRLEARLGAYRGLLKKEG